MFAIALAAMAFLGVAAQRWNVGVAKYKGDKKAAVSLTFDDGLAEHYTIVAPELERRGMRGTFGVCGSTVNADSAHMLRADRVTWPQLRTMAEHGHEISNHGWAHRNHGRTPLAEVATDIERNDSAIERNTGVRPTTFFYPNNTKTEQGVAVAERGRVGTRLFQRSVGSKWSEQQLEAWVQAAVDTCGWIVGMTHGITYGYDAFKDKKRLTDFLDYLQSRQTDIWVGRLTDVLAYSKERDSLVLKVEERGSTLTVTPRMPLDATLFNEPLTLKVTGKRISKATATQDGKPLKTTVTADGAALLDFSPQGGAIKLRLK